MNKKIFIPAEKPEDWRHLLVLPMKHWKERSSAKSLAYCWQEANGLPKDVEDVLLQIPEFNGIEALIVIPEYKVLLPGGSRPSQTDCWVLARTRIDLISIAVEGKMSEPFGPTIGEWLTNASGGKTERLSFLCCEIGINVSLLENIRYQLLHRTASAIIAAKRFHAKHAVMLVHSFSKSADWFDDYEQFMRLFKIKAEKNRAISVHQINDIHLHFAWVSGNNK